MSSDSQLKIHRLVPRRKVKPGSFVRGAAVELGASANARLMNDSMALATGTASTTEAAELLGHSNSNVRATDMQTSRRLEVTPDKSPKPQYDEESSSSGESSDERTALISEIDLSKLSPGVNPQSMSNYELLRLRNIQRNEAKLASLGLVGLTTKKPVAAKSKPKKKAPAAAAVPKRTAKYSPSYVSNQSAWHVRHTELASCVNHGPNGKTLVIPSSNKSLSGWVRRQKKQYQKYKRGEKNSLNDQKVDLLLEVADDEFWMGAKCAATRPVQKPREREWSVEDESIGSEDSYSEDERCFTGKASGRKSPKKTAVQRELEGLRSPKWMDGHSDDDYFAVNDDKTQNRAAAKGGLIYHHAKKQAASARNIKKTSRRDDVRTQSAKKCQSVAKARGYLDNSDSERDISKSHRKRSTNNQKRRNYVDQSDSGGISGEESDEHKPRRSSKSMKRREPRKSSDFSDEGSCRRRRNGSRKRVRYVDYYDDESFDSRGHRSSRPSRKYRGRQLSKDYSHDDESSVELRGVHGRSASKKHKKQLSPPKPNRAVARSSLELLNAPPDTVDTSSDQQLVQRLSKRKGVVSEESERPTKRVRRESTRKKYHRYYESESSSSSSDDMSGTSYSSTSISAASTKSTNSSSFYGTNNPINEVFITQQTNMLTTHKNPHDELRELMAERYEIMLEYKYLYACNLEKMKSMRNLLHEMHSLETTLVENGSALLDKMEGTEQLITRAKAKSVLMLGGTLLSPEELYARGQKFGLIETSRSEPLLAHRAQHLGVIEGPPQMRREVRELEWI